MLKYYNKGTILYGGWGLCTLKVGHKQKELCMLDTCPIAKYKNSSILYI